MPEITKRRVTMRTDVVTGRDAKGKPIVATVEAVDYVRPDHLDAYVADARTRWQTVEVSEEPDAGPAGYHGATHVPEHLELPDAGVTYPETPADQRED